MAYTILDGKLQYLADTDQGNKDQEQNQQVSGTVNTDTVNTGNTKVRTVNPIHETRQSGNVIPTNDERITGISNARNLEEALASARDESERETQVKKRLANNAFMSSLASTIGALGKFAVVAGSKDGRDVQTGDAASGSRKAYEEAVKRSDKARERMEALEKEKRTYQNALDQLSERFRNQRMLAHMANLSKEELEKLRHGYKLEQILEQKASNIARDDNASQNRREEIKLRNEGQQAVAGMRNAQQDKNNEQKAEEAEKTRQHQAEQKEKDREAAQKRAETSAGGSAAWVRGGAPVKPAGGGSSGGGSGSGGASGSSSSGGGGGSKGKKKHSHKRDESKDF